MKKNNFDIEIFKELGIDINLQEIEFTKEIKTISKNEEVDQLTSKKYLEFKNKDNKQKKEFNSNETFENYLNYEKEKYIKASKDKEYKQFLYTNRIIMQNTKTNEAFNLNHSILQKSRDNYLYFFYTQKLMEEKYIGNDDYFAIFLTLTTPSIFHKYSSTTKKLNPKFNKELTINDAYKLLNSSFREIYKNFKIKRKFVKVEYSKVLEPHKNLTPHLHAIIYIQKNDLEFMQNHIKNVIKKNGIGEHKIEVINDTSRSSSYLLKYIQKTTNPKNEEEFHFFNGWKKVNKIRIFTSSSSILDKAIYKKINTITKLSNGLDNKNAIQNVLDNCQIKIKQNEYDIDEDFDYIKQGSKTKIKGNKNGRYKVKVVKEKINKIKYVGKDFFRILNEENGFDKNKILEGNFEHFEKYLAYFQVMLQFKFSNKKLLRIYEDFNYYANNQKNEILVNFNEIYLKNKYIINVDAMLENKTIINKVNLFDLIFKDLTTTISYYKVVDFKIYDKLKKEVIYNKKDFTFEMNQELSCMDIWKDEFAKEKYLEDLYGKDFFYMEAI